MLDLLSTKDTSLVGQIGEFIAWKYLWQKGIHALSPREIARACVVRDAVTVLGPYEPLGMRDTLREITDPEQLYRLEEEEPFHSQYDFYMRSGLWDYDLWSDVFSDDQIHYVTELVLEGSTWCWDFVGYRRDSEEPYLIEVKTSRVGKKYGLKSSWSGRSRKGYSAEDLERAKSLGFKLLLVNVGLLVNWQFEVVDRELKNAGETGIG